MTLYAPGSCGLGGSDWTRTVGIQRLLAAAGTAAAGVTATTAMMQSSSLCLLNISGAIREGQRGGSARKGSVLVALLRWATQLA